MGVAGSKANPASQNIGIKVEDDEQVYFKITNPVELHPSLVDRLSEPSTEPNPSRQTILDESVKQKLKSDLENLKKLEAEVESKLSQAFQSQITSKTENDGKDQTTSTSSTQLMQELSSIKQKAEKFRHRNSSGMWPEISSARTAIVSCLTEHRNQPLKCDAEVSNFKQLVQKLEREYVGSLQ